MMETTSVASSSPSKPWSETRRGRLAIFLCMISLFVLVSWLAIQSRRMVVAPLPALVVDEKYLSLGEVWEDPAFIWSLPITNSQGQDIEIKRFHQTCTCIHVDPSSLVIPAGKTRKVQLTLNLAAESTKEATLQVRDFAVGIAADLAMDGRSVRTIQWKIRGRVRKALSLSEPVLYYPHPQVRGEAFESQKTVVRPRIPVLRLEAHGPAEVASVQVTKSDSEQEDTWEVKVWPLSEKLPVGPFEFDVLLQPTSETAKKIPATRLPVKGRIVNDIQAVPSDLLFGAQRVGEKASGVVTLRSSKGQRFEVEGVESPSDTFVQAMGSRAACSTFQILQSISKQGDETVSVRFRIKTASAEKITAPVGVNYYGVRDR